MSSPKKVLVLAFCAAACSSFLPTSAGASFFSADSIDGLAPVVVLHRAEDFNPTSGKDFLDHADLAFGHDGGCASDFQRQGKVDGHVNRWTETEIAALGDGDFVGRLRSSKRSGCALLPGAENAFSTRDLTRPRQGGRDSHLDDRDGWYLDLAKDRRSGFPDLVPGDDRFETKAPTYFDDGLLYSNGKPTGFAFVTYWFFYAYDETLSRLNHEGDWENISIKLRPVGAGSWAPAEVFYARHGKDPDPVAWSRALKAEFDGALRLRVFSARGSHASYGGGESGLLSLDHIDKNGPGWATWNNLRFLWDQGWAGYCGAWGAVGRFGSTTGPLGPACFDAEDHPVKSGRPRDWGDSLRTTVAIPGTDSIVF